MIVAEFLSLGTNNSIQGAAAQSQEVEPSMEKKTRAKIKTA